MKKVFIGAIVAFFLWGCEKAEKLDETMTEPDGVVSIEVRKQLATVLKDNPKFQSVEANLKKDKVFDDYLMCIDFIRESNFKYRDNKYDEVHIQTEAKNAKNFKELTKVYEKAGMKDASKRLKATYALAITRAKLCREYPEFCSLTPEDETLYILSRSNMKVDKNFLKKYTSLKK
jgi:hypothetical protein